MIKVFKRIPKTVVALGVVSFLTDFSSEMIYPLIPYFLTTALGSGAIALGIIEGVAETTASILKIVSGLWTDKIARRKPFVIAGYGLAGAVRPLIGFATVWPFVLLIRFLDRVGKGIRTSPRDALIADVVEPERRGAAYGFHRMMDHGGAMVGPLVAAALLSFENLNIRIVFFLAAIPAALVMVVLFGAVREPQQHEAAKKAVPLKGQWKVFSRDYKLFLIAVIVFTLGNSTDAFVLLRLTDVGVPVAWVAVLWSLHHAVKMGTSYMGGSLSDRLGRRKLVLSGWAVYAVIYLSFGLARTEAEIIVIFILYGVYYGLVEPVERAWVADLVPANVRGSAMGYYHASIGLAALPASVFFGVLWHWWGAQVAFATGAGLAVVASFFLVKVKEPKPA